MEGTGDMRMWEGVQMGINPAAVAWPTECVWAVEGDVQPKRQTISSLVCGDAWFYNAEAGEFFFGARPAPWVLYQTAATVTRVQHISLPPFESITRVNGDDVSHVRNTIQHSQ